MNALALPRLLVRFGTLYILLPLFWAVFLPYALAHEHGAPFGFPGAGGPGGGWQYAAWQLALFVPAVVGFAVGMARLELQHAAFSWTLPALRRSLTGGVIAIAVPLAAACAVAVARSASTNAVLAAAAAFAVAMFAFAVAFAVLDAALPRGLRYALPLLLVPPAFRPALGAGRADAALWAVAVVAITAAAALLLVTLSRDAARRRHFRWSAMAPHRTVLYWASQPSSDVHWTQSLATDRLLPWLRAIVYESRHPRISLLGLLLFMVVMAAGTGLIGNNPIQILIITGVWLVGGRPWLDTGLFHPLSRRKRADIMTAVSVAEAATLGVLFTMVVAGLARLGVTWPGTFFAVESPSVSWAAAVGVAVAFAPVAQWSRIAWPGVDRNRIEPRRLALLFAYYVPAFLMARAVTGYDTATVAVASLVIAMVGYTLLWAAARRHYDRADLVGRGA